MFPARDPMRVGYPQTEEEKRRRGTRLGRGALDWQAKHLEGLKDFQVTELVVIRHAKLCATYVDALCNLRTSDFI